MKLPSNFIATMVVAATLCAFSFTHGLAAATLTQQIDPVETKVGEPVIVTLTVQGGSVGRIQLPTVDGLGAGETSYQIKSIEEDDGSFTTSVAISVSLTPTRPGDFTIPSFDIHTQDGDVLHVAAMKLHVTGDGTDTTPAASSTNSAFNPNGPVVLPPTTVTAAPDNGNSINPGDSTPQVPRDIDGGPAKVFIIITPQTTDAYVGQAVPMRIDFFIRMDVNSEQNSLPTIKGSDFLMNSFTTRGQGTIGILENEQYGRESWTTAISAPKSGDFPLSMERDTYWIKSITNNNLDPFGGFFSRHANLAHELISSNQMVMHVHPLPEQGRPAHFTGAIGQFRVSVQAQPSSVSVGEPVTLYFSVTGQGNFDYVRCPALASDPAWKAYVPYSKTNYGDESHTMAIKTFEQAVIPQKNGDLPLPQASFSYFDPTAKQYVTVPIALPVITVTGSPTPLAANPPDSGNESTALSVPPEAADFFPNRLEIGSAQKSLIPFYGQPFFWAVEVGMLSLPLFGVLLLFVRSRMRRDDGRLERARHRRSLQQEEDAMSDAVRRDDALAFFTAARHAIQLQLGTQWNVRSESLTLREIRSRDPQLAELLAPLFQQADEVIYSGRATPGLDLPQWENRVRTELLQPQPA
jgi:hypothetical protein